MEEVKSLIYKKDNYIPTKKEFLEDLKIENDNIASAVYEKITYFFSRNSNAYDKYIPLISVPVNDVNKYLPAIRTQMFNKKNIYFNICVTNWFLLNSTIYIKIYNKKNYEIKCANKFNKMLNEAKKNNKKCVFIQNSIANKNILKADCYVRNYNMMFGDDGYVFYPIHLFGKYYVVVQLE